MGRTDRHTHTHTEVHIKVVPHLEIRVIGLGVGDWGGRCVSFDDDDGCGGRYVGCYGFGCVVVCDGGVVGGDGGLVGGDCGVVGGDGVHYAIVVLV